MVDCSFPVCQRYVAAPIIASNSYTQKMSYFEDIFHGKLFFLQNMCTHNIHVCVPKVFGWKVYVVFNIMLNLSQGT